MKNRSAERETSGQPDSTIQVGRQFSEAEISERAYEIFLKRGGEPGNDLDDWLQAERELQAETPKSNRAAAAKMAS